MTDTELTSTDERVLQYINDVNERERDGRMPYSEQVKMAVTVLAWELWKERNPLQ